MAKPVTGKRLLTLNRNRKNIEKVLFPLGVSSKGVDLLARKKFTSRLVSKRLERMEQEKIPLKGLVWRMQLSNSKFEAFIKRFKQRQYEDRLASKKLTRLLPGWTKFKVLKKLRSLNILQKVEVCLANGIMPTPYIIVNYSAKSIASRRAKTPNSLNARELLNTIGDIDARCFVVDALVARPHLAANKTWLKNHLMQEHKISKKLYQETIEDLQDLGVLSSRNGYFRISRNFRTGTKGWG